MENPALDPSRPIPELKTRTVRDLRSDEKLLWMKRLVVLDKTAESTTKEGLTIWRVLVADESASVFLTAFHDRGTILCPGDVIEVKFGFSAVRGGELRLYIGKLGQLIRHGRGVALYDDSINISKTGSLVDGPSAGAIAGRSR